MAGVSRADAVTDWNEIAVGAVIAAGGASLGDAVAPVADGLPFMPD